MYSNESVSADVAIVGLGPGGLAAALCAAQNGRSVVAFTDRAAYIRGQRVVLYPQTLQFLRAFQDPSDKADEKFFDRISKEQTVQTKDIERYLYKKLMRYQDKVSIVQLDKELEIQSLGRGAKHDADFIQLSNGTKYYTKNILAADGAQRSFSKLMNRDFNADLQYIPLARQERHKYHAVVQLQVKEGASAASPGKKNAYNELLAYMRNGWNNTILPKHYVFPNKDKTKFYFAGEIPEKIFRIESKQERDEQLKQWVSVFVYKKYGLQADQLEYRTSKKNPKKDSIQANAFEMNMSVCNKQMVPLSNGVFAQIGDARRSPNFYLGHGLNDAIMAGVACTSKGASVQRFESVIQYMDERLDHMSSETARPDHSDLDATSPTELLGLLSIIERSIQHIKLLPVLTADELTQLDAVDVSLQDLMTTSNTVEFVMKLYGTLTSIQELMDSIDSKQQLTEDALPDPVIASALSSNTMQSFRVFLGLREIFNEESSMEYSRTIVSTVKQEAELLITKDCRDIRDELYERYSLLSKSQKSILTSLDSAQDHPERLRLLLQLAQSLWPNDHIDKIHFASPAWPLLRTIIHELAQLPADDTDLADDVQIKRN